MSAYHKLGTADPPTTITTISPKYTTLYEEVSPTLAYVGKAAPGSLNNAAVWKIQKMETVGGVLEIRFAGSGEFSQIWNDRAVLSYI